MKLKRLLVLAMSLALSSSVLAQRETSQKTTRLMSAGTTKPLSAEDAARVKELLQNFDPNSYSLKVPARDASDKVTTMTLGNAKGLSSVQQTAVERRFERNGAASTNVNNNIFKVGKAASTNVNNNIFRVASTNVNNNVFKAASTNVNNNIFKTASTNVNNNVFVNDKQAAAARELNEILQRSVEP